MGLILDTGVFVLGERRAFDLTELLSFVRSRFDQHVMEISVITIAELTHGIYRAESPQRSMRRNEFVDSIAKHLLVHDLTPALARLVGQIEGEQAALGNIIPFEDLVIGSTALLLGHSVLTTNPKHFQQIPALAVHTL
jgi:tRNA(fMet)-specific endonuclease VapC